MLSSKSLKLYTWYYKFAGILRFTPFHWDNEEGVLRNPNSTSNFCQFLAIAILMWVKVTFSTIRFIQSCTYLEVTTSEIVLHFFLWMLMDLSAVYFIMLVLLRHRFPACFQRVVTFNTQAKEKYLPHLRDQPTLKSDGLEPLILNVYGMVIGNAFSVFFLFWESPKSPQFFYSVLYPYLPADNIFILLPLGFLEGYIMAITWTTIFYFSMTWLNHIRTLNFWLGELNLEARTYVTSPNTILRTPNEIQRIYRQLQCIIKEFNDCHSFMTCGHKVPAFLSHLGSNYGSFRFYSIMPFQTWVSCPILSVCGSVILVAIQTKLALVSILSEETIHSWWKVSYGDGLNSKLFRQFVRSSPPIQIASGVFYHFKRTTMVTFFYNLMSYTISLLMSF